MLESFRNGHPVTLLFRGPVLLILSVVLAKISNSVDKCYDARSNS